MLCSAWWSSSHCSEACSGSGWIESPSNRYCVSGMTARVKRGLAGSGRHLARRIAAGVAACAG